MISIEIKGFPMPPSANELYANGRNGGRFKTQSYRAYEQTAHNWAMKNQHILTMVRGMLAQLSKWQAVEVDRTYYFKPHKIITKEGRPRRNDTSNRIKACDDVLSSLIGIDDCYFWDSINKKRPIYVEGLEEWVDITLTIMDISFQGEQSICVELGKNRSHN